MAAPCHIRLWHRDKSQCFTSGRFSIYQDPNYRRSIRDTALMICREFMELTGYRPGLTIPAKNSRHRAVFYKAHSLHLSFSLYSTLLFQLSIRLSIIKFIIHLPFFPSSQSTTTHHHSTSTILLRLQCPPQPQQQPRPAPAQPCTNSQ